MKRCLVSPYGVGRLRGIPHLFLKVGESPVCSGAHNLAIAARLASLGALPAVTMLAASTG